MSEVSHIISINLEHICRFFSPVNGVNNLSLLLFAHKIRLKVLQKRPDSRMTHTAELMRKKIIKSVKIV